MSASGPSGPLVFFVVCCIFSKLTFSKNYFRNIIRMLNSLDPDQARHIVGPDLGPICLPWLSADGTRQSKFGISNISGTPD